MNWNVGPVLAPAGTEALRDAPLAWALIAGAALLFTATMALLAWAVLSPPRRTRPLRWVAGGGLLLPLLVLGALLVADLAAIRRSAAPPPANALQVGVSAQLWWWELRLHGADGQALLLANELHVPVGRAVRLGLSSDNVIHSLWVPALAGKMDLVPGRVGHLVLQAERPGTWAGPCAEFCGEQHTRMALQVVAQSQADFDAWLANQALPARQPATAQQQRGRDHFIALRCGACHTVRGVTERDTAPGGPDLTHLASRSHLGAGTLPNDAAGLAAWITAVQQHKAGAQMPSYPQLDAQVLQDLVAWLGSLQ